MRSTPSPFHPNPHNIPGKKCPKVTLSHVFYFRSILRRSILDEREEGTEGAYEEVLFACCNVWRRPPYRGNSI